MKNIIIFLMIYVLICLSVFAMDAIKDGLKKPLLPEKLNDLSVRIALPDNGVIFQTGDDSPPIEISANQPMYILVFHVKHNWERFLLWPDPWEDPTLENYIIPEERILIPSFYTFSGDYSGKEYFQVFGFRDNSTGLDDLKRKYADYAFEGKYATNTLLTNFLETAQKRTDFIWNSDTFTVYYNITPVLKQFKINVDFELCAGFYFDGKYIEKGTEKVLASTGEHIISYYKNDFLQNKIIKLFELTDHVSVQQDSVAVDVQETEGEEPETQQTSETQVSETPKDEKIFIFSVGISNYNDANVSDLKLPSKDARDFVEALNTVYHGKKFVQSKLLTESEATKKNIERFLSEGIYEFIDEDTEVYFFFSGHGTQIRDQNGDEIDGEDEALVPVDFNFANAVNSLIVDDDLYEYYSRIASQSKNLFVIIDSCFSGGSRKGIKGIVVDSSMKSIGRINSDAMESEIQKSLDRFVFLSASRGDEEAWEDPQRTLNNSLFTYFLLQGLQGDANLNNDKFLSPSELFNYTEEEMRKWLKQRDLQSQTPVFINPDTVKIQIPCR